MITDLYLLGENKIYVINETCKNFSLLQYANLWLVQHLATHTLAEDSNLYSPFCESKANKHIWQPWYQQIYWCQLLKPKGKEEDHMLPIQIYIFPKKEGLWTNPFYLIRLDHFRDTILLHSFVTLSFSYFASHYFLLSTRN